MAFLFKSKNKDRHAQPRDGTPSGPAGRVAREEKTGGTRSTPTGSIGSLDDANASSPDVEKYNARRAQQQQQDQSQSSPAGQPYPQASAPQSQSQQASDLPLRNQQQQQQPAQNPNASLYPWSQRRLAFASSIPSPFPRYGAAVNAVSSKEGDIYVMGGLINSSTVKGDLWMIEAGGNMTCYPLATTAEGPGPRVGHASLLVGNAFIVYGGDTKIDETDVLDETLYLLNTSTRQWSRALPAGPRPSGRYGHSLNIIGSKIFVFGGQVEGFFMNDLVAFDLNQLQMPNNKWELLIDTSEAGSQAALSVPPARTNHSVVTYNDKLYLFGGTNGFQWFNDVWCYDPATNQWTQLDCIGYIPVPREGHAASLVGDVMYIFGGRTEEGADLGDLAAFRIGSRRWYTFQNMGPSPSPRSGHSMTAVGQSVVVVGGEPSSATSQVNDLSIVYVLDTTKIRYPPNDSQVQTGGQKIQQGRRPSNEIPPGNRPPSSRDGSIPPDQRRLMGAQSSQSQNSPTSGTAKGYPATDNHAHPPVSNGISKLPRAAGTSTPSGPPPQGQLPKPGVSAAANARPRNASIDRIEREATRSRSPSLNGQSQSPTPRDPTKDGLASANGRRTPNQQGPRAAPKPEGDSVEVSKSRPHRPVRGQGSIDSTAESGLKNVINRPSSPPPPTRQASNPLSRRGSNRNSQTVTLLKELDAARNRNAWYASELELARKSGYISSASLGPALEGRSTETFDDEDKPLIEALLAMRQELANVQSSVDKQAVIAAKQIAEAEKQRDAAVREAVYAKAKMAAHTGSAASTPQLDKDEDPDGDRSNDLGRKLASALTLQKDLQTSLARINSELEAERRARQLADETSNAAQKRMADLEGYKQQKSAELDSLRAQLHMAQREAREQSVANSEAQATLQLLRVEKDSLESKVKEAMEGREEHDQSLASLRDAISASADLRNHLERKLNEERTRREEAESNYQKAKAELDAQGTELINLRQQLRDAEELAERHEAEANSHRQAILSGLGNIARDSTNSNNADAERIATLEEQIKTANGLVRKYQQEADAASDQLRSAEERIAGLEAYQEQSSREGVTIRRQLQSTLKDIQSLQAMNSDLKSQLASQQLETNAVTVQHNTLKDILSERGISPTSLARVRGLGSRNNSPDPGPSKDLERQLAQAIAAHEETKQTFAAQAQESETAFRDRISQLENDYQSAVHYVKGTEKMLKKMKEELAKYKADNARLKTENLELEERSQGGDEANAAAAEWHSEREALLRRIETLEEQVQTTSGQLNRQLAEVRRELDAARQERDDAAQQGSEAAQRLAARERDLDDMQHENALLEKRAQDAEQKVSLLLDQVENSVDNYRRQSRISSDPHGTPHNGPPTSSSGGGGGNANGGSGNGGLGHTREESSEAGSLYGGLAGTGAGGAGGVGAGGARNSAALDNLANELDMLRSHWEATNKNYRLSNTFEFDGPPTAGLGSSGMGGRKDDNDAIGLGLSASLADWRKRLDSEEAAEAVAEGGSGGSGNGSGNGNGKRTEPKGTTGP